MVYFKDCRASPAVWFSEIKCGNIQLQETGRPFVFLIETTACVGIYQRLKGYNGMSQQLYQELIVGCWMVKGCYFTGNEKWQLLLPMRRNRNYFATCGIMHLGKLPTTIRSVLLMTIFALAGRHFVFSDIISKIYIVKCLLFPLFSLYSSKQTTPCPC